MEKKYQTVSDTIQKWITTGRYQDNAKLPTESELMKQFDVSRHTVRKALEVLKIAGYVYRVQGGGTYVAEKWNKVSVSRMKSVAVMATYINDYIFPSIIFGVEQLLSAHSVSLMLSSTQNDEQIEAKNMHKLLNSSVDGLIVEPTRSAFVIKNEVLYARLQKKHIPIITINSRFKNLKTPYFMMDDFKAGCVATKYILDRHHHNILGVFKTDDQQGIDRMNGFIYTAQKAQAPNNIANYLYQSGEAEKQLSDRLKYLFQQPDRPTALICYNDRIAVLAYNVAQTLGIKVPEELSLIGFDNSLTTSSYDFDLTSINHPKGQMGHDAAALMLDMIEKPNQDFSDRSKIYPPELIVGNSVKDIG